MAISVIMPALEMAQESGKIISWLKQEGDSITKGEMILEIETDKVVVELEAPADGVLAGVRSNAGDVVPVGQIIAWIVAPGEQPPAESEAVTANARAMTEQARPQSAHPSETSSIPAEAGAKLSPKARRLARENGVDISKVNGTGPDGTITTEDILAAAKSTASSSAASESQVPEVVALSSVGRLMAERTTQSWKQVPHFFLFRDVDAGELNAAREQLMPTIERDHGVRLTHTDILISLVARTLAKHPRMNASWVDEGIRLNAGVNISVAMAVKDGVVGVVMPNADTVEIAKIAVWRKDLTERARLGRLRPADVAGGTFTISNLGMYGIDAFGAIITQPQAAVLAIGRIAERVVPIEGRPGIRPMMTLTLSSDHRVVDGAQSAAFLRDLNDAITGSVLLSS